MALKRPILGAIYRTYACLLLLNLVRFSIIMKKTYFSPSGAFISYSVRKTAIITLTAILFITGFFPVQPIAADYNVLCDPNVELIHNGSFESPVVTASKRWDIFPWSDPNLMWQAANPGYEIGRAHV